MTKLDKIDAIILQTIIRNSRLTADELAGVVNLSSSACQRRLKRLRSENVIEAEVALVSPSAVGREIMMIVLVSLERDRADIVDRFKRSIRNTPEIMMGYYITGDADFLLMVTAKSMVDYEQYTRRFLYDNPDIKEFKTMVVLDSVKIGFEFPIDPEDPQFTS